MPLAPPNDIRKQDWIDEYTENILKQIAELIDLYDRESDEADREDIKMLEKILAIELEEPQYIWTMNPVIKLRAYLRKTWNILLNFRAENANDELLTDMFFKWQQVRQEFEEGDSENWYNPDFNVVYDDEKLQELMEQDTFSDDDIDYENRIFGNIARWEELWQPALEAISDKLQNN